MKAVGKKNSSGMLKYVVFCTACGHPAPLTDKVDVDGHLMYDWHRPCPRCGKEEWATRFLGDNKFC